MAGTQNDQIPIVAYPHEHGVRKTVQITPTASTTFHVCIAVTDRATVFENMVFVVPSLLNDANTTVDVFYTGITQGSANPTVDATNRIMAQKTLTNGVHDKGYSNSLDPTTTAVAANANTVQANKAVWVKVVWGAVNGTNLGPATLQWYERTVLN